MTRALRLISMTGPRDMTMFTARINGVLVKVCIDLTTLTGTLKQKRKQVGELLWAEYLNLDQYDATNTLLGDMDLDAP